MRSAFLFCLLALLVAGPAFGQGLEDRVMDLEVRADETDVEQAVQDADILSLDADVIDHETRIVDLEGAVSVPAVPIVKDPGPFGNQLIVVTNGDFEQGVGILPWTIDLRIGATGDVTSGGQLVEDWHVTDEEAFSGTHSLSVSGNILMRFFLSVPIAVDTMDAYSFCAKARTADFNPNDTFPLGGPGFSAQAIYSDGTVSNVDTTLPSGGLGVIATGDSWNCVDALETLSPGKTLVGLRFGGTNGSRMFLDAIEVRR